MQARVQEPSGDLKEVRTTKQQFRRFSKQLLLNILLANFAINEFEDGDSADGVDNKNEQYKVAEDKIEEVHGRYWDCLKEL